MDKEKELSDIYEEYMWELEHWAKIRVKAENRIKEIRFKLAKSINATRSFDSSQEVVDELMQRVR